MIEALHHHPLIAALLMVIAPVALAWVASIPLRRNRFGALFAALIAPLAAWLAWWAIPYARGVSAHDLFATAALFSAALVARSRRWLASVPVMVRRGSAVLALIGVVALELRARRMPPPPMTVPEPENQMLVVTLESREFGVTALYPDRYPPPWMPGVRDANALATLPSGRRVLHLGDSMVAAGDVGFGEGFADVLSRETGDAHINLGVSNSSTDLHLMVFRTWQPRIHGALAVLHLFTGNDLDEIDRPYAFCGAGPLLGPRSQGMPSLCPTPRWRLSRPVLIAQGPSPYPLRVLAFYSALARQVTWRIEQSMNRSPHRSPPRVEGPQRWNRIRDAVETLRDEAARAGVSFVVVTLPFHSAILGATPAVRAQTRGEYQRFLDLVRAAGVRSLDPLPELEAAVNAQPGARWFLPPSPHFDVDGHRWYARWLSQRLPAR